MQGQGWNTIEMETRGQGVGVGSGCYCEEAMSRAREGVLASRGTINVFLVFIVFGVGRLRRRSAKGYLCRRRVVCVG